MKQEVSKPVIIGVVVAVVAVAAFFLMRAGGTQEFAPPKDVPKIVPQYVWDSMPEDQKAQMTAQGYKPGEVDPSQQGQPKSAPGATPK